MPHASNYIWASIEKMAPLVISFAVSVLIARVVSPAAYGLIGMMAIFMALGQAFSELGFGAALVQRPEITRDDETSVLVINIVGGAVITATLCVASPLIADFFDQSSLVALLCVQSLTILIASTALVQFALLARQMRFRLGALIEVAATVVSGLVGVAMAYTGYGVWSLVGLTVSREMVRAVLAWLVVGWRPTGRFSWARVQMMWTYSSRLLYSSILSHISSNLYAALIGRHYTPEALGFYMRASGLYYLPISVISSISTRVAFPLFSRIHADKRLLLKNLRSQVRICTLVAGFVMALFVVLATELVTWLFGPRWTGSIPVFQILCVGGAIAPAFYLHYYMTMALGRSDLIFRLELLRALLNVVVLVIAVPIGLNAIAWGAVLLWFCIYCLSAAANTCCLSYSWRMQVADLVPAFLVSGGTAALLVHMPWDPSWAPVPLMMAKTLAFLMVCGLAIVALRRSVFADAWAALAAVIRLLNDRMTKA